MIVRVWDLVFVLVKLNLSELHFCSFHIFLYFHDFGYSVAGKNPVGKTVWQCDENPVVCISHLIYFKFHCLIVIIIIISLFVYVLFVNFLLVFLCDWLFYHFVCFFTHCSIFLCILQYCELCMRWVHPKSSRWYPLKVTDAIILVLRPILPLARIYPSAINRHNQSLVTHFVPFKKKRNKSEERSWNGDGVLV